MKDRGSKYLTVMLVMSFKNNIDLVTAHCILLSCIIQAYSNRQIQAYSIILILLECESHS